MPKVLGWVTEKIRQPLIAGGLVCDEDDARTAINASITLPLFSGGNNVAQLRYAEAEKKGLIATYEKAIQSAFKDVADALARRETLNEQLDAQREYVAAEQKTLDVATRSYQAGAGDYLTVLTAQRSLWSASESLISLQKTDFANRITLWQSLGGGGQ
jgi:multidrug efflux system outer membrane protein